MNIKYTDAIKRMREMSDAGIMFSFSFLKYSTKTNTYGGIRTVDKAFLSKGFRKDQSTMYNQLISFVDVTDKEQNKFFHLPLLFQFNNIKVVP